MRLIISLQLLNLMKVQNYTLKPYIYVKYPNEWQDDDIISGHLTLPVIACLTLQLSVN